MSAGYKPDWDDAQRAAGAEDEARELTACSCRWAGDTPVFQCTLHEGWAEAIGEWAQRAKAAEEKLRQTQAALQRPTDGWTLNSALAAIAKASPQ